MAGGEQRVPVEDLRIVRSSRGGKSARGGTGRGWEGGEDEGEEQGGRTSRWPPWWPWWWPQRWLQRGTRYRRDQAVPKDNSQARPFLAGTGGGSGEAAPGLVVGEHPQQVISWVLISSLHRVRWVLTEGLEARSSGGLMSPRSLPSQLITPGRGDGGAVHLAPPPDAQPRGWSRGAGGAEPGKHVSKASLAPAQGSVLFFNLLWEKARKPPRDRAGMA